MKCDHKLAVYGRIDEEIVYDWYCYKCKKWEWDWNENN